ncbi:hypothetical protein PVL29_015352 [Vitis rotundifolia]|uniref:Uncharacterized protein n=1 Tax=Vitis rotundifolia TaxID=103349 RepID=A0AA38ZCP2_VITRO|nr:hypothetical protein PVL29_015352 [Vitis rotundifolia]
MNSKAFTFLSLLFAVVLLTSFMVSAETSLDEKNVEAADEKANQAADVSTQDGGGGHGGGTHGNERGISFLSYCARGCCAWGGGARTFCVKCCSNTEEAQDNTKYEPQA